MTYPIKPKRRFPLPLAIVAAVAAALCCAGGLTYAAVSGDADKRNAVAPIVLPEDTFAPSSTAPSSATKATVARSWDDGTWAVGSDIKPGTYVVSSGEDCYWARLRNFEGSLDSIIANGNTSHGRVTIKKTDKGLELSGGCVWVPAGS